MCKQEKRIMLIDCRMRDDEKKYLSDLGFYLIEIPKSKEVYTEISSHVDIFCSKIGRDIIIESSMYEKLSKNICIDNFLKRSKFSAEKNIQKI